MALSRIVHIGNGTTRQFAIPFALGYIEQSDITCRVGDEVDGLGDPVYRELTFLTDELVEISGAAPGDGVRVLFDRTTSKDQLIVDFEDDAVLNEENLNTAQRQALMVAHEALDGRIAQLQADIDANGYQITNLRTPTAPNEAANKAYVDSTLPTAVQQAEAAANTAVGAAGAATAAASVAGGHASAAGAASGAAAGHANTASTEADRSRDEADRAHDEYLAATASADRARDWAEKMDGAVIEPDNYSAKYWANVAMNEVESAVNDAIAALDAFTGTDGTTAGVKGLVPAPATGDVGKFLSANGSWLKVEGVVNVSSKDALAALAVPSNGAVAVIMNDLYGGVFVYNASNLSAKVTQDPQKGFYIAPTSAATGASGAWVRLDQTDIDIRYFGAVPLTLSTASSGTNSTAAIQAALAYARAIGRHVVKVPDGIFRVDGQIILPRGTALHGPGPAIGVRWNGTTAAWDYQGGAILAITRAATSGNEEHATILMSTGTGLQGLSFWYPTQSMQGGTVIQHAWTIGNQPNPEEADGTLEAEYIRDCHVTNAYRFCSWLNPQGPCDITNVKGFSIKEGFRFDNAYDILRMSDVHWNPIMVYVGHWPSNNIKDKTITAQGTFVTLYKADQAYFNRVFCWGPYYGLVMANSAQAGGGQRSANGCRFVSCGFEGGQNPLSILGDAHGNTFYSLILGSSDYAGTGTSLRGTRCITVTPVTRIAKLEFYDLTIFDTVDTYASINNVDHLRIENGLWEGNRRVYPEIPERALILTGCTNISIKGVTIQRGQNITGMEINGCRGGYIWGNFFRGIQQQRCIAINGSKALRIGWNFNLESPGGGDTNTVYSNPNNVDVAGDMAIINAAA